jgi:hypothetical protein
MNAGAAAIGITVRGAASQSANLQEWQNSAGTILSRIGSDGIASFGTSSSYSATLNVSTATAAQKGLVVRGSASQSALLTEWQNSSGNVVAYISNGGAVIRAPLPTGVGHYFWMHQ